jgi:hypothetical protein
LRSARRETRIPREPAAESGDRSTCADLGDWDPFRGHVLNSPGACVIAAVNGYAFATGLETALLADVRIAAENAEFGALERRWNTLPQGAISSEFMRRDSHTIGAGAFKRGERPEWPHQGL